MILRRATSADLPEILPLAASTVPGFVEFLWSELAVPPETGREFGTRAQLGFIERGETMIAEVDGHIAGFEIAYQMEPEAHSFVPGMCPLLKPHLALFHLAAGSWYLHGLGTVPEFRGQGVAGALLDHCDSQARENGCTTVSLLVIDTNTSAINYYLKRGFTTIAREPVVKGGWQSNAREWLLMTRPV